MAKKASAEAKETAQASEQQGLPVFYKTPAMLDKARHAKASIAVQTNYAFAKATNSLALNVLEFVEAGKFYPIVFTDSDQPTPIAVLGLEKENYFIAGDGKWKADTYIPAYARQYPFIFFQQPNDEKIYLCIDEGAPHFNTGAAKDAQPLFNTDGTPSELTNNALQFCTAYFQEHAITRNFCKDLKEHKLLVGCRWDGQLSSGKKVSLSQFMMINEAAFNALPDDVILDFRKKGWLGFIYLAMASASNWKRLETMSSK